MWIVFFLFNGCSILFVWLGYLVKYKHVYGLISGYNTMTEQQKAKVNTLELGNLVGNLLFAMALLFTISGVCFLLRWDHAGLFLIFLIIPVTIYAIIKAQTYDGNTRNPDGTRKKSSSIFIGAVVLFLAVTGVAMGMLFVQGGNKPVLEVDADYFRISGLYGTNIALADITVVETSNSFPQMKRRVSGYAVGSIRKGKFRLISNETAMVYLNDQDACVLKLQAKGLLYFISMSELDCAQWSAELKSAVSQNTLNQE